MRKVNLHTPQVKSKTKPYIKVLNCDMTIKSKKLFYLT
jgi:hypothetical protein